MNQILAGTLHRVLAVLSRAVVRRYDPRVIAITGTAGKTSTKDAIFLVLEKKFRVRRSEKSFNTEIGVPLTILGGKNHYKNIFGWAGEILSAVHTLTRRIVYPEVLVLEYGVQKPGDMSYLLGITVPYIAVVTSFGTTPVHVEYFKNPKQLFEEKANIVKKIPKDGWVVFNDDDPEVMRICDKTKARVLTFGFSANADIRISNYELRPAVRAGDIPGGISFKLEHKGTIVPVRMNCFGRPQVYVAAAAAAVAVALGQNLVEVSGALARYESPVGRLRALAGIKGSVIIDDTYNSSPIAVGEALELLRSFPGARRIAVLGDMKELGDHAERAHRAVGEKVARIADIIYAVGPLAHFIAEESRVVKKITKDTTPDSVLEFPDAITAGKHLDHIVQAGDVVLVKGSQSMRMEKTVFEVMAFPERAAELLARQDDFWRAQ